MTNDEQVSSGALNAVTTTQKQLNGYKGGQPVKLSRAMGKLICNTLATSEWSLLKLCQAHPEWPSYSLLTDVYYKNSWFSQLMREARERQADHMAIRTQDVAKEMLATEAKELTMPKVQAAKLLCENTRWYAGKILKRIYGDDQQINVDARTAVVVGDEQLKDLRARLDGAKQLVKQTSTGRTQGSNPIQDK